MQVFTNHQIIMDTKQEIVFIVGEESLTYPLNSDTDFFLESPLLAYQEDFGCSEQNLVFDLTKAPFVLNKDNELGEFLIGDVEIMMEYFLEEISFNDYPRAYGIYHFIVSHSGLIKEDEALNVKAALERLPLEEFEEITNALLGVEADFVTTKEVYDVVKNLQGFVPFQAMTVKANKFEVVHCISMGDGVPLYPSSLRDTYHCQSRIDMALVRDYEMDTYIDLAENGRMFGIGRIFKEDPVIWNAFRASAYPSSQILAYYANERREVGCSSENCWILVDYEDAEKCHCYDLTPDQQEFDLAEKDGMKFMFNLMNCLPKKWHLSDRTYKDTYEPKTKQATLDKIKSLIKDYDEEEIPFIRTIKRGPITLRGHFGFIRL